MAGRAGKRSEQGAQAAARAFGQANASFVSERLAVGGDLSANFRRARSQLDELVAAGITHIVDLRSEWTDETLVAEWAPQVRYLHHPVADAGQVIGPDWFAELVGWVDDALDDPQAKVLLHCHMGVNRAPSAALAVLLSQGVELRPALNAIRGARPVAIIDYARDALDWHLLTSGADARARRNARRRLGRWRGSNQLDATQVIRAIRDTETAANRWWLRLDEATPDLLAELLESAGELAIGLPVTAEPPELSLFDEVFLITVQGLVGRALVVGPPRAGESDEKLLPLLARELFPPVALTLPRRVANWLRGARPNLRRIPDAEYRALTLAN